MGDIPRAAQGSGFLRPFACSGLMVEGARGVAPLWSETWIRDAESSESDASAGPEFYVITFRMLGAPRISIEGRREGTDLSSFAVAFVSSPYPYPSPSSGDLLLHSVRRVVRDQGISRVGFATCCQCDGVTLVTCITRTRQWLTIIDMSPVTE